MNILSINTALKTNSIPKKYFEENDIYIFLEENEISKLHQEVVSYAKSIISFESLGDIAKSIKEIDLGDKETRVFCVSEDYMIAAADAREFLNIPGLQPGIASKFRDKTIMKQSLDTAGLRVPKFGHYNEELSYDEIKEKVGIPFVLKPIDSLGAMGVYVVSSEVDYLESIKNMKGSNYEYEEYISGTLYHIDTLLENGNVVFQTACAYSAPNLDFQKGKPIISIPMLDDIDLSNKLKEFTAECISTLGLTSGPSHTEVFILSNGELVFLESAARTPGAMIVPLYEKQYGFNMIEASLQIELGEVEAGIFCNKEVVKHYMSGIFPTKSGILSEKLDLPIGSSYDMEWKFEKGQEMPNAESLRNISASFIACNENYNNLNDDFIVLRNYFPYVV